MVKFSTVVKFVTVVVLAVVALGVIGIMIAEEPGATRSAAVPVLLIRDSNELRFTNDSDTDLFDCTVTIDGGFSAVLRELKSKDRKFLVRAQFSAQMPRDEFYSRTLRSVAMDCFDGPTPRGEPVAVRLR